MKKCLCFATLFVLALGTVATPIAAAQSEIAMSADPAAVISSRISELEKQIVDLRAELAAMKTPAAAPATAAAESSQAEITEPAKKPTIAGLLGPTSLSGFVDVLYGLNFNHPSSHSTPFRAFDFRSDQFSLNYAKLQIDKAPSADNRTGYRVSLGFGDAINTVNLVDSTPDGGSGRSFFGQYLQEAYFSYLAPVGSGLQFDVGKYVTPHGAEVIETKDNLNYTRGLLFTWAIPFYHFGARAKYTVNDKAALSFFMANGWNNVIDNNSGKTYGVSLALTPSSKFSIIQAYMAGPEQAGDNDDWRHLADTVVTISPSSKLSFIVNFDYGHDRVSGGGPDVYWTGVAGYVKYAPSSKYALVARYEYFDDHDGFMTGTPQAMKEFTGTFQRTIANNIIARLEYRHDYSNQPVFVKGINPVFGQDTLTAGLVFTFDSREAK